MNGEDCCEHDVEGFCMLCCRDEEGKPAPPPREPPRDFEEAMDDEPSPP